MGALPLLTSIPAAVQPLHQHIAAGVIRQGDRKRNQPDGVWSGAGRVVPGPDVQPQVVMVAARRDEQRARIGALHHVEAQQIAVKRLGAGQIADLQVNMPDVRVPVDPIPRGAIRLRQQIFRVERLRHHRYLIAPPRPLLARSVGVEFQPVVVGIGQVQRLAHAVIGGSLHRPALLDQFAQHSRQRPTVRQADGHVIQAGGARLSRRGVGAPSAGDGRAPPAGREINRRILPRSISRKPSRSR